MGPVRIPFHMCTIMVVTAVVQKRKTFTALRAKNATEVSFFMKVYVAKIMIKLFVPTTNAGPILMVRSKHSTVRIKWTVRAKQTSDPVKNTNIITISAPAKPCPSTHPFVYYNGNHCCKTNKEGSNFSKHGVKCDASELQFDSMCCENNNQVPCMHDTCTDYVADPPGKISRPVIYGCQISLW